MQLRHGDGRLTTSGLDSGRGALLPMQRSALPMRSADILKFGVMTMNTARTENSLARKLLYSTAGLALLAMSPQGAHAQEAAQTAQLDVEQIVVTGSRIVRDGYEAPTPVSVLGATELNAMNVTNIADAVNRLPSFSNSVTPNNSSSSVSSGTGGVNNLNLRGLTPTRTLVLLDGKRVVGSTLAGFDNNGSAVDVNAFPNGLISRVDVVTGGASAVYGSDALAGVVNFVLDKDFTGIKGSVEGGITSYGDNESYKVTLTGGTPFASGRGHFLFSGEHIYNEGILHNTRPWGESGFTMMNNPNYTPTNGQPQLILMSDTGLANATRGGLITSGPLRGTQFLEGGTPAPFIYGSTISGVVMSGGDSDLSRIDNDGMLALRISRISAFSRASYDVTDNATVFAELAWTHTAANNFSAVPNFNLGNVTVQSGNPFIPASVQAQMTAQGIDSFSLGTVNGDMPFLGADNNRIFRRYVAGVEGNVDAFNTNWSWDAYYARSTQHISARSPGNRINDRYNQAIDTVTDPNTGQFVCRSTLTNPGDGCVPYNPMGIGVNSDAAINYVHGTGYFMTVLAQDVFAASASGEPFSTWAGPVSVAFGAEHRKESVDGFASALDGQKAFFAGNYIATTAKYHVTEGFVETVVPLAKDTEWARSFDLNAAVRATSYSESGYVTTWKVGATYTPVDDLTLRVTRSRDIRAPNLGDLFNAGRPGTGNVTDPVLNQTYTIVSAVEGNPNLQPEKANTTGIGAVYTPTWLPGFGASVDFYNINIKGAISSLSNQQYLDRCFAGTTALCSFIDRDANNVITFIHVQPANILSQKAQGLDMEASYNFPLSDINAGWGGELSLRAMGTYVFKLNTIDQQVVSEGAGVNTEALGDIPLNAPKFRYLVSATYSQDAFSGTLSARGISSGKYGNNLIECVTACPTATAANPTINNNHIDAVTYFDLALNYKVMDDLAEVFFTAENFLDQDPPRVAGGRGNGFYAGQDNGGLYDRLGRTFRAGVRFSY